MAELKEKKEKVVKKSEVSREEFDNLAAKLRLMSDNWHKFCAKHIGGGAKNGSIDGHAKISGLAILAIIAIAGFVLGLGIFVGIFVLIILAILALIKYLKK